MDISEELDIYFKSIEPSTAANCDRFITLINFIYEIQEATAHQFSDDEIKQEIFNRGYSKVRVGEKMMFPIKNSPF